MKKISLVACGVLLSSSMAFGANTIDSAFKEGKVSGSLALYGEKHDIKGADNSGFANGNATIAFETASFYGLTAKAEFKGNLDLGEVHNNDRDASFENDSFYSGLLDHPHYTRPEEYEGMRVPDILMSGHHKNIDKWRLKESLKRTLERRADIMEGREFTKEEEKFTVKGRKH